MIIGGFAAQAQAQSNVTIYGIVDAGIVSERGGAAGSVTKVTSGIGSQSRLGFRGTEDLGNGLSAIFQLETGVKIDDGSLDNSNSALFSRQAYVGLKSKEAGTLTIGRQYTMLYNAMSQVADPFGAGYAGSIKNLFPAAGANTRVSNAVVYATPVMSGFSAEALYALGEQAGSSEAGRQFGLGLNFSQGALNARLVYNNRNNDTVAVGTTPAVNRDTGRNTMFAMNYNFKVVKAYFAYGDDKGVNSAALPVANAYGYAVAPRASPTATTSWSACKCRSVAAPSWRRTSARTTRPASTRMPISGPWVTCTRCRSVPVLTSPTPRSRTRTAPATPWVTTTKPVRGDKAFNVGVRHSF